MKFTKKTTLYKGKQGNWFFVYTGQKIQGNRFPKTTIQFQTIMIGTPAGFFVMSSALEYYIPDGSRVITRMFLP